MNPPRHDDVVDVPSLRSAIAQGWQPDFLLFWGHTPRPGNCGKHVFSQWWPAPFTVGGCTYPTAEHYMMAEKARLFGDEDVRARVLAAPVPGKAKALGRQVRGFDPEIWATHGVDIVVRANAAKFGQNPILGGLLRKTGDAVLVEASPVDLIWGIGLAADDPRAMDPEQWPGSNLLGFALMRVRRSLG